MRGTVNWYGDYSFLGNWDIPSVAETNSPTGFDANAPLYDYGSWQTTLEIGFLTGTMERIIGNQSNNPYIWSVMYYDNRGRTVQQSRRNPMGGWDRTNTGYSYTGRPLKSRTVHFAGRLIQDNRNNANALKTSYDYNLSSLDWTCGNDSVTRMYEFTYDGLSRLTNAVYGDSQNNSGTYSRAYTYDLHGNILSLTTPSGTVNVSYSGNRRAGSYTYDSNGNLTSDQNAGLTGMTYNALNLLSGYTHSADGYDTRITYTASGEKTDVFTEDNQIVVNHWHRSGNLIYDGSFSSNRLLVDGGYVDVTNAGYSYRFYIQDHQGNNRMVTDANGTVLQVNHYDPYGQLLSPISSTSAVSEYKYAGKEWDALSTSYDFGARRYMPAIPRWTTMDPLAEKYYSLSPYVYCAGNPVNLVDPDGRSTRVKKLPDGTFEVIGGSIDDEDLNVFVYSPDENGEYTIKGESIGITTSITSFYHAEIDTWKGVIDINDVSGMVFLDRIVDENQSLLGFALDARKEQLNDFKNTNGTVDVSDDKRDMYRGMPVGITSKGRLVFSSARDIGNMAAGYKSGLSGLGWIITRMAFDGYQSYQSSEISFESISSVNAQFYGWKRGFGEYLKRKKTFKR